MAKSNSRYIQFYTPGSVACKVELRQEQEWVPLPAPKPQTRITIAIDPVAIIGFAVAVCMLVLMAVGIRQLNRTRQEVAVLEGYVAQLTAQNHELKTQYEDGYDLDVIRQKALDMGMIPTQEVAVTGIEVTAPVQESAESSLFRQRWEAFTSSLFA